MQPNGWIEILPQVLRSALPPDADWPSRFPAIAGAPFKRCVRTRRPCPSPLTTSWRLAVAFNAAKTGRARSTSVRTESSAGVLMAPAGRGASALRVSGRRAGHLGGSAGLHDQGAWRDHAGEFRVAEFPQQAPNVAIDRLLPDILARLKIAADQRGLDARVEASRIESQQTAFAVTRDADRDRLSRVFWTRTNRSPQALSALRSR